MEIDINTVLEELKNSNVDRFDLMHLMTRGIRNKFHPEIYLNDDQIGSYYYNTRGHTVNGLFESEV